MLLEYGFKNYFSFRQGADISFRLDGKVPEQIANGKSFTTVLGFKGANASGKTTALKAMQFLANFIRYSFFGRSKSEGVDEEFISLSCFFDSEEPCEFYAEFETAGTSYRYELVATDQKVERETIYKYSPKRTVYLERKDNEITIRPETDDEALASIILRSSASIVSTLTQHKTTVVSDVANFFQKITSNVNFGGLRETPVDIQETARYLHKNPEVAAFVEAFIRDCDAGVCEIATLEIANSKGEPDYVPMFVHSVGDRKLPVHYYTESSGTKALYRLLPQFKRTLDSGGILVLDEIDAHLHPHLLPKLVGLFLESATNPKGAQLLFSTHDSKVLDLLGRYRTYLVNKEGNESYAYRLDEIPGDILRNDRPISPIYGEGRIGGVPRL